ncbi:hypothetical protein L1765_01680 [Microaerobacter geothermalis]|uniref:hypothetical protein n=1 Tax=Microaerobacter geothermalis TaxID=674972 RepID=UPI001F338A8F|nr:hypothetical protein [Microaerobacter geothermalis]MCF6092703.1 hypothetical protein [Microaerobacter geothermalis]
MNSPRKKEFHTNIANWNKPSSPFYSGDVRKAGKLWGSRNKWKTFKKKNKKNKRKISWKQSTGELMGSPFMQLVFSILGAVVVGLVLGFMILSMFSIGGEKANLSSKGKMGNVSPTEGSDVSNAVPLDDVVINPADTDGEKSNLADNPKGNDIIIPARTYYVIQGGVFSDQSGAQMVLDTHRGKGWAGIVVPGKDQNTYAFYMGVTQNRDDAIALGQFYKEKQVEIYVKDITFPAQITPVFSQNSDQNSFASFMEKGDTLFQQISSISANGVAGGGMTSQWASIQENHRLYLEEGKKIYNVLSGESQLIFSQMMNDVTKGVTALQRYQSQPSPSYLWQAQDGLLNYILHYQRWLKTLPNQ